MRLVGLTGGIASGKSTFAGELETLGIPVLDADDLARVVVDKVLGLSIPWFWRARLCWRMLTVPCPACRAAGATGEW